MSKPLTFKVVLLGDKGVGKTSLFVRLKNDLFTGNKSTLGVDTEEIVFDVKGRAVKVTSGICSMVGTLVWYRAAAGTTSLSVGSNTENCDFPCLT